MSYLHFEKGQVVNLEYSLSREIIRTNRAGSYTSTTIVGCNTRKYHGLLVCPVDELGGERYVLLSSLDVTVVNNDKSSTPAFISIRVSISIQKDINT
ncbi:MAG TPA: glycogen debranching enzyme N-terminal domain-containing protein [Methanospirillum sp.]|nr:glycogen debranching enzyme N-terminal domain-containing protein [Methanospirillum sp.]